MYSALRHWGANAGLYPLKFLRRWIQHLYRYHGAKFQLSSNISHQMIDTLYVHTFQRIFGSCDPQGQNFCKFFSHSVSRHSCRQYELSCIKFGQRTDNVDFRHKIWALVGDKPYPSPQKILYPPLKKYLGCICAKFHLSSSIRLAARSWQKSDYTQTDTHTNTHTNKHKNN